MKTSYIVNFSGGKDSTAMLFKLIEQNKRIDHIVFFDFGAEYPEMYAHIKQVNQRLKKYNLSITVLKPEMTIFEYMTVYKRKYGKYVGLPKSFPSFKQRWCTKIKISTIRKFEAKLNTKIVEYIGFTTDELKRAEKLKKLETATRKYEFPLIELGMSEKDALNYCYSLGFDWGGLYEHIDRVSCYVCPFQTNKQLSYLINHRPELWAKIKFLEANLKAKGIKYYKFRKDKTCEEIEKMLSNKYKQTQKQKILPEVMQK